MRIALGVLFLVAAGVAFAGRPDGQFRLVPSRTEIVCAAGADECITVPPGSYVRTVCPVDAYVGGGVLLADAGTRNSEANECTLPDAGPGCSRVRFSAGVESHMQLVPTANRVCAMATDGGALTCQVSIGMN